MKEQKEKKLVKKFKLVGKWEWTTGNPSNGVFTDENKAKFYAKKLGLKYIIVYEEFNWFDNVILY